MVELAARRYSDRDLVKGLTLNTVSPSLSDGRLPQKAFQSRFAEREEIVLLRTQGLGVREIARQLDRAVSTISRELRRNAATRGGGLDYRATTAQWHADRSARQLAKLVVNPTLRDDVQERLAGMVVAPDGGAIHGPAVT
jgi:transposase-like protein